MLLLKSANQLLTMLIQSRQFFKLVCMCLWYRCACMCKIMLLFSNMHVCFIIILCYYYCVNFSGIQFTTSVVHF